MFVEFKDPKQNTIYINTGAITWVIVPSILSGGDGLTQVFFGQTMMKVPEAVGQQIFAAITVEKTKES